MFAIHTIFIKKENILFLEEWLCYHIILGFTKFYLYDNSKCQKPSDFDSKNKYLNFGYCNKSNINYDEIIKSNKIQTDDVFEKIMDKYKDFIVLVEWSPLNKDGFITYGQEEGHADCLKRLKFDKINWCANIDMDEYIVINKYKTIQEYVEKLDNKISNIKLSQKRFESRFNNIGGLSIDINKCEQEELDVNHSNKNIYMVNKTSKMHVHSWIGYGLQKHAKLNDIWFNHYKLNNIQKFKNENNINPCHLDNLHNASRKFILQVKPS
jgi:hypothetical protein